MSMSPIQADHVTMHYHEGPETPSQAVGNYAGAALLIGLTFMAVGTGIGYIMGGFPSVKAKAAKAARDAKEAA